jgi:hypothetical protein
VKRSVLFLVCGLVLLPTAANARDYYYFNKPAVARETYIADKLECDRLAGGVNPRETGPVYVMQNPNLTAGQNALAVGLASLFAGLIAGGENRRVMLAVERTCMADKGYGRFKVEKTFVKQIDTLKSEDDRIERYFALATTTSPMGTRIKE